MKIDLINDQHFRKYGHLNLPVLSTQSIYLLKSLAEEFEIHDPNTYSSTKQAELKSAKLLKQIRKSIINIVSSDVNEKVEGLKIVNANFMIKDSNPKSFIPPHQDTALTREDLYQTIYCWIPLVNTSIVNGAICFINGSHKVLNAPSPAWPNPRANRYLDDNVFSLFNLCAISNLKAGEGVFFNNKTFHGSLPNFSNKPRLAIRIGLIPKQAKIYCYLLKPNENKCSLYQVDSKFFDKFSNEMLLKIYDEKREINEYPKVGEIDYFVDNKPLDEFKNDLKANGLDLKSNPFVKGIVENQNNYLFRFKTLIWNLLN